MLPKFTAHGKNIRITVLLSMLMLRHVNLCSDISHSMLHYVLNILIASQPNIGLAMQYKQTFFLSLFSVLPLYVDIAM